MMSKELTPLEIVKRWKAQIHWNKDFGWDKEIATVEKELTDAEKNKKALEIIKEKILDMDYFNIIADRCDLTYQEYELLKEILK